VCIRGGALWYSLAGVVCLCYLLLAASPDPSSNNGPSPGQAETEQRCRPGDAKFLISLGDALFRQSRFEQAESAYRDALKIAPQSARAHYGLGRIEQLRSHHEGARDRFATAYRLDWRDPAVVLAYAAMVQDSAARKVLLRNFLLLAGSGHGTEVSDAKARLEIEEHLGSRALSTLASPYRSYRLRLDPYIGPNHQAAGLLLKAGINGGKPLRLIVDTGANGILVTQSAVRDAGLEFLAKAEIGGLGGQAPGGGRVALARTVSIGDFQIENCLLKVTDSKLASGVDGVIGTNVFQEFLVRLDAPSSSLDLVALAFADCERCEPAYRVGHLLLVRATLDGENGGYFLLDSAAAYSAISRDIARQPDGRETSLRGARGVTSGLVLSDPIRFQVGPVRLIESHPVALDLTQMSSQEGVEISGIIGYSVLRDMILTIDYRDGLVEFSRPGAAHFASIH